MTHYTRVRTRRCVGLLAFLLMAHVIGTEQVFAQTGGSLASADTLPIKRACFRGRPQPTCDRYWLTEFGLAAPILNEGINHSGNLFTWELGRMKNVAVKHALGAAIFIEVGHLGDGFGLRPRYRRWLDGGSSLDIAPGMALATQGKPGFSGHVALNFSDYAAVSLHLVSIREQTFTAGVNGGPVTVVSSTRPVVFAGGRLGGKAGTVTGMLVPLGAFLLYSALCSRGCD